MTNLGGKEFSEDTDPSDAGGQVNTVVGGAGATVNSSDPVNPSISVDAKLTTKGDVFGYDTGEKRIPVGTNDQVLTADSTAALGVAWKTPAAGGAFEGALVTNSGTQTINSTTSPLTWNTEDYDVGGWHDNGTNPTRLTVPAGVAFVRLTMNMRDTTSVTGQFNVTLTKNGTDVFSGGSTNEVETAGGDAVSAVSAVIAVIEGDFFEMEGFATTSRTTDADGRTNFSIEKVG